MWDENECEDRRLGVADILSSWGIAAAILVGAAAWTGLRLLVAVATAPIGAGDPSAQAPDLPLILEVERPAEK